MVSIAFFPLLILALLVLGGVAAVVYLVARAIANRRSGALLWVLLVPLGLLLGISVLAIFYGMSRSAMVPGVEEPVILNYEPDHVQIGGEWPTGTVQLLDERADHDVQIANDWPAGTAVAQVNGGRVLLRSTWVGMAVMALLVIAAIKLIRRMSSPGSHHGSRLVPVAAILLAVGCGLMFLKARPRIIVQRGTERPLSAMPSMGEMWNKMNEPRITLEADSPPSPLSSSSSPMSISPETAASLRGAIAQVEALARHVAVVAKQMSDVAASAGSAALPQSAATETAAATVEATVGSVTAPATTVSASAASPAVAQTSPTSPSVTLNAADVAAAVAETGTATASVTASAAGVAAASEAETPTDAVAAEPVPGTTEAATSDAAAAETSAKPRPGWVDDLPKRVGNTWREVIVAGEYASVEECYRAADVYLLFATYDHLMQLTGAPRMSSRTRPSLLFQQDNVLANGQYIIVNGRPRDYWLSRLASAGIGIDYIRRQIANEEYVETVERSVGPMKTLYTLVEFSPSVDRELLSRWDGYRRNERFAVVGVIAGSVLGLLGFVYGLLKIDTWTKGYYSKRLFLGVPAAIIVLIVLIALLNEL